MDNSKPIESFKKYFLDVKPYHTKILEIIEKYLFQEDLPVQIDEKIFFDISFKNNPLCKPVGYGLIWDGECGFDAVDCCDLFQCLGGFGVVFDNSDLVVEHPINSIDSSTDIIYVSGDQTYDVRGQIDSIPTTQIIEIVGDFTHFFLFQKVFLIVPVKTLKIASNTSTIIRIDGDFAELIANEQKFRMYNTSNDNGIYTVLNAVYDTVEEQTVITILESQAITPDLSQAVIEFKIGSKNNGGYIIKDVAFDGDITTVTVHESTTFPFTNTTEGNNHGSIQLRTGMLPGRYINVEETGTAVDGEYQVLKSEYKSNAGETAIHITKDIDIDAGTGFVRMYGYIQGEGFDGLGDCGRPKHSHIKTGIYENLLIEVSKPIGSFTPTPTLTTTPTPTPTGTIDVTPTATVTPTVTPTATPGLPPTLTPTATVTPAITLTPTVTPTMTVTPTTTLLPPTPSVTPANLLSGLVSWWTFNETSGNIRVDSHGPHNLDQNDGHPVGHTSGKRNNAAEFDGLPQYLRTDSGFTLQTHADFAHSGSFAIAGWVQVSTAAEFGSSTIMTINRVNANQSPSTEYSWKLDHVSGTDEARLYVSFGISNSNVDTTLGSGWKFVYAYFDDDANELGISVNNGGISTTATPSTTRNVGGSGGTQHILKFGRYSSVYVNALEGKVDEWGFWHRKLTPAEVTSLYNNGNGTTYNLL